MFNGIIRHLGKIESINSSKQSGRLVISSCLFTDEEFKIGDSVAVNGVCLTLACINDNTICVDFSTETFTKTNIQHLKQGSKVNLEPSMVLGQRVDGSLVSGHIDTFTQIQSIEKQGEFYLLNIQTPKKLQSFLAVKGSVVIDGVSLTLNYLFENTFQITLIPHTFENTLIQYYEQGTWVNIEVDLIARYLFQMMQQRTQNE